MAGRFSRLSYASSTRTERQLSHGMQCHYTRIHLSLSMIDPLMYNSSLHHISPCITLFFTANSTYGLYFDETNDGFQGKINA